MKGLSQFKSFDFVGFSVGKVYKVVGISDWADHDTGHHLGKRVTNLFERLTFKIAGDAGVAIGDIVIPVDVVARCYGDYNNMLSVTCKGIRVVPPQEASKAKE